MNNMLDLFSVGMRHFCTYCWVIALLACSFFMLRIDDVPVVVTGHRVGTDNTLYPGQYNEGVFLIKRDLSRNCDVKINVNIQSRNRVWAGEVFSQNFSWQEVRWAEKTTPGQFIFPIKVPLDILPGEALLATKAEFKCYDNLFHKFTKATADISQLVPVTIGE